MTNLKPFNLECALAGDPVVSKDGNTYTQFFHFSKSHNKHSVYCVDKHYAICRFTENGCFEDIMKLYMAPNTKKLWIDINKESAKNSVHLMCKVSSSESFMRETFSPDKHQLIEIEIEV